MKGEITIVEKIIISLWDIIVFFGVFMFALDFTSELCNFLGINSTFTLKILALAGCIYLWGKSNEIKDRKS